MSGNVYDTKCIQCTIKWCCCNRVFKWRKSCCGFCIWKLEIEALARRCHWEIYVVICGKGYKKVLHCAVDDLSLIKALLIMTKDINGVLSIDTKFLKYFNPTKNDGCMIRLTLLILWMMIHTIFSPHLYRQTSRHR